MSFLRLIVQALSRAGQYSLLLNLTLELIRNFLALEHEHRLNAVNLIFVKCINFDQHELACQVLAKTVRSFEVDSLECCFEYISSEQSREVGDEVVHVVGFFHHFLWLH